MSRQKEKLYYYPELRMLIWRKYGTIKNFARALGVTEVTASAKLTGRSSFSLDEIKKVKKMFNLSNDDVWNIFFTH